MLGNIGEVRTQTVTADDVTERIVDLESRIKTAEVSVERLQALLAEATDIKTIANVENQLLQRETDLETLRGQLRTLQDRVALATITLTLTEALANPQIGLKVTAYPGSDDAGSSCPGQNGISVEKGETATLCFKVNNPGDTPLTDFTLTDTVLGIETGDLIVVVGNPAGTLQPGQSFTLAFEVEVDQDVRTRTRVEATPINQDGEPIEGRTVAATTQTSIQAVDPGGLPGFSDGLEAAWDMLLWLGGVIVLFAGLLLPFIWVPIVLWLIWRWRRKRMDDEPAESGASRSDGREPPPSPRPKRRKRSKQPSPSRRYSPLGPPGSPSSPKGSSPGGCCWRYRSISVARSSPDGASSTASRSRRSTTAWASGCSATSSSSRAALGCGIVEQRSVREGDPEMGQHPFDERDGGRHVGGADVVGNPRPESAGGDAKRGDIRLDSRGRRRRRLQRAFRVVGVVLE